MEFQLPNTNDLTLPIYSTITNLSSITNIIFIDNSINDSNLFLNSLSNDTFAILYNFNTNSSNILDYIQKTFTSVNRIGFVFHGYSVDSSYVLKRFLNMGNFFENSDLTLPSENFTENVKFIINILNLLNVKHLDFLGCNLATIPLWKSYFELIASQVPQISIGASIDNTGNISNTSNWIMETTHEDIKNIYFNSNINSFSGVLILYDTLYDVGLFRYNYNYNTSTGYFDFQLYSAIDPNLVIGAVTCDDPVIINEESFRITSIREYAFVECNQLTSIILPNSLKKIGEYAFANCSGLISIQGLGNVTRIGGGAFYGCSSLTSINIPNSITIIEESTFTLCTSLTSLTLPDNLTTLSYNSFSGCSSLTSIVIPLTVTNLGVTTFSGCTGLTSIVIPPSVTSIGFGVFNQCTGLTSIVIPSSITSIGQSAFNLCSSLASIRIPDAVSSIGINAFLSCISLTSISLPANLITIPKTMLSGCTSLTSLIIPNTVTTIGLNAFKNTGLTNIYYSGPVSTTYIKSNTGAGAPATLTVSPLLQIYLNNGWNIIGTSYSGDIIDFNSIIINNTIYSINNSVYNEPVQTNKLLSTKGYFIKTSVAGYISIINLTNFNDSYIDVSAGWNLFGVSDKYSIYDPSNGVVPDSIYSLDSSNNSLYVTNNILYPNKGYFLKSTKDTRLYLQKIIYMSDISNNFTYTVSNYQRLIFDISYNISLDKILSIRPLARVDVNPNITIENNGDLFNYGTIQNNGIIVNNSLMAINGSINSTGGKDNVDGTYVPSNGAIINSKNLQFETNVNNVNNVNIGALFNLAGSTFSNNTNSSIGYISNYNNFTNPGTLNSNNLDNRGTFTNGGSLIVSGQTQLFDYPLVDPTSTFNNNSIINITNKYENFSSGLLNNNTNGTMNVPIFNNSNGAQINNAGSIIITSQFNTSGGGTITNTGTISVAGVLI